MVYKFNPKVVNASKDFLNKKNFVGYILPNGSIYECKNHNITNVSTFLRLYLKLLDIDYDNKNEILNVETNDELAQVVMKKIKTLSHEEIHALLEFVEGEIILSDILVGFFDCHLISRINKTIITSALDHHCFYNYLLNDIKIYTIHRIVYDPKSRKYQYINGMDRNDYLYDEIKSIKDEITDEEVDLFTK